MKRPISIYTPDEFDRMLRACPKKTPLGIRNRAILAMLYGSGIRVSELITLMPSDVGDDGAINVRNGKGSKQRFAAIDSGNLAIVDAWKAKRKELGVPDMPLFCTASAGRFAPMDRHAVWTVVKRLSVKAGIDKRVHPHGFRHSFTNRKIRDGVPINILQRLVGHSSIRTTGLYVNQVSTDDLVAAVNIGKPAPRPVVTLMIDGRLVRAELMDPLPPSGV